MNFRKLPFSSFLFFLNLDSQFGGTLPRRSDNSNNSTGLMNSISCNDIIDMNCNMPTIKPRVLSPCKITNSPPQHSYHQQHNQQLSPPQQHYHNTHIQSQMHQQPSQLQNQQQQSKLPPKEMEDLIHLPGPLTEDAVMRTLQARFNDGKHFVSTYTKQIINIFINNFNRNNKLGKRINYSVSQTKEIVFYISCLT